MEHFVKCIIIENIIILIFPVVNLESGGLIMHLIILTCQNQRFQQSETSFDILQFV